MLLSLFFGLLMSELSESPPDKVRPTWNVGTYRVIR